MLGLRLCCDELAPWAGITPADVPRDLDIDYLVPVRGSGLTVGATRPDRHTPPGFNRALCTSVPRTGAGRAAGQRRRRRHGAGGPRPGRVRSRRDDANSDRGSRARRARAERAARTDPTRAALEPVDGGARRAQPARHRRRRTAVRPRDRRSGAVTAAIPSRATCSSSGEGRAAWRPRGCSGCAGTGCGWSSARTGSAGRSGRGPTRALRCWSRGGNGSWRGSASRCRSPRSSAPAISAAPCVLATGGRDAAPAFPSDVPVWPASSRRLPVRARRRPRPGRGRHRVRHRGGPRRHARDPGRRRREAAPRSGGDRRPARTCGGGAGAVGPARRGARRAGVARARVDR